MASSCLDEPDEPAFLASADDNTRMLHKRRVLDETSKALAMEKKSYHLAQKKLDGEYYREGQR